MKDNITPSMKGTVTLRILNSDGSSKLIAEVHNDLQLSYKEILIKRLIQHPTSWIDRITVLNGNTQLAQYNSPQTAIIAVDEVSFEALFNEASFNGPFDLLKLTASGIGDFSIVDSYVGNKASNESLLITWKIKIL